jgi:hypothetical protein
MTIYHGKWLKTLETNKIITSFISCLLYIVCAKTEFYTENDDTVNTVSHVDDLRVFNSFTADLKIRNSSSLPENVKKTIAIFGPLLK